MKAITANALTDGRVIYLGKNDQWCDYISDAQIFDDESAPQALANASERVREVADIYLIDVTEAKETAGREALREEIRSLGPTMRLDLGKQAEL